MTDITFEVTTPSGDTITPTVFQVDDVGPEVRLTRNNRPEARIPVPYDERYSESSWIDTDVALTVNGDPVPVDTLEGHRIVETGIRQPTRKVSLLICRGGPQLKRGVDTTVAAKPTHAVAEDLLTSTTGYTVNVDAPTIGTANDNVIYQGASTTAEFRSILQTVIEPTDPIAVSSDELRLLQSCYLGEAEDGRAKRSATVSDSAYSAGTAETVQVVGDRVEIDVTTAYRIPEAGCQVAVRFGTETTGAITPEVVPTINGQKVSAPTQPTPVSQEWIRFDVPHDLPAGEHSIGVVPVTDGDDKLAVDVIAVLDSRFSYTFDNSTNADEALAGPELFPDQYEVVFEDAAPALSVTGGGIDVTMNDTSNNQALAVSNDRGDSYATKSNAGTFEHDFTARGAFIRGRLTLSRWGSGATTTPTTGYKGQSVSDLSVKADVDDMPMVVDERIRGRLATVLSRLARTSRGNFAWSVEGSAGALSVEFAPVDERSSDRDPRLVGRDVDRDVAERVESIQVTGATQQVSAERLNATVGSATALDHDEIQPGSEAVYEPASGPDEKLLQYTRGKDYTMDYPNGELTALAGGRITDGEIVTVDYAYQPLGSEAVYLVSNPDAQTVSIPRLTTDRACLGAARRIVDAEQTPRNEATALVAGMDVDYSVVTSGNWTQLPTVDSAWALRQVTAGLPTTEINFESRLAVDDIVADLRAGFDALGDQA